MIFRLAGWLGVAGLLIVVFTPLSNCIGGRLFIPAQLGPAGAIVVLGGPEAEHRAILGLTLLRNGLAPRVVFSGNPFEVETGESLARNLGVPSNAVIVERRALTTRDEAVRVGAHLRAQDVKRVLLVTDALGMWRARGVFERAGFEVLPVPSTGPGDAPGRPQDQIRFSLSIAEEAAAYVYYRLMGYL